MPTIRSTDRSPRHLRGVILDLKSTMRGLRRRPAFAATAVITMAIGIGATTAMYSAVDAILLRALPYSNADRLVSILPQTTMANQDIDALRERSRSLDQVAGFSPGWLMALTEIDTPRQLNAARVSGNMFTMIGVRPLLGRAFGMESETPSEGKVAVLGYELWQTSFGGDSAIIGRTIALDGGRYTVVAVMPRGFQLFDWQSDLWTPLTMGRDEFTWKGETGLAFGRLRPGQTAATASAEISSLVPVIRQSLNHTSTWGHGTPLTDLREYLVGNVSRMLWFLFGSVVFLLLIASGNVANLLLVRAAERQPEIALRRSLGAPSGRIARLLLGESLLLGVVGGAIGVMLATLCVRYLPSFLPRNLPRLGEVAVNGRVLVFAALATLGPALAFGFAPVLQAWKSGLGAALRQGRTGSRSSERVRGTLVSVQVALSLVLLVGAAIMGRSLSSLLNVDRGLRSDHLLTATVQPTGLKSSEDVRAFWRDVLSRIEGIPGVTSAATILHLPTSGRTWMADIQVEGRPLRAGEVLPRAAWQSVSTKYFATAGVPVLLGRPFNAGDGATSPRVMAVNSAFAQRIFPGESPIGKRIVAGNATRNEVATIVAVVGGVRHDSLSSPPAPEIYLPMEQLSVNATSLVIRTTTDPIALGNAVRDRIYSVSRNVPITNMRSMDDVFLASLERPRLILAVLALFAGMGLVLGAVGIYGIVAYGVQQRVRELGIRAALGADARSLRSLVLWGGVRYALMGALIGVPVAFVLSRLIRGLVFGVAPTDPLSFSTAPVVLVVVAAVASWLPARRAARSDPMRALREE